MKKLFVLSMVIISLFLLGCSVGVEVVEESESTIEESVVDLEEEEMMDEPELDEIEELEEEMEELTLPIVEAKKIEVKTSGLSFSPDEVIINVGDSVEFTTSGSHNAVEVTEEDWESGKKTPKENGFNVGFGETKEVTFDTSGTYYYVCQPHAGMGMKGKVIVN